MNFKSIGDNVLISEHATIYGTGNIEIGNNVRIDDFCILSAGEGGIQLGSFIHISSHASIIGKGKVIMKDFSGLSSRVSVFSSNDDYSGENLTNPMVPQNFTNVYHDNVFIGKHVLIGSGSVVLPGVTLNEGCAIGALSLVNTDVEHFKIAAGNPLKLIRDRSRKLLVLEKELLEQSKE